MSYLISAMLVVAGLIHIPPVVGFLDNERLAKFYGVTIDGPDMSILMRHRAVLFGILGTFLIVAAFVPVLQTAAFVAGFASVVPFLWLVRSVGTQNANLRRAYNADVIALVCLIIGTVGHIYLRISA